MDPFIASFHAGQASSKVFRIDRVWHLEIRTRIARNIIGLLFKRKLFKNSSSHKTS